MATSMYRPPGLSKTGTTLAAAKAFRTTRTSREANLPYPASTFQTKQTSREVPAKYSVTNVYGDLGQLFAYSTVAQPRLAAAMMGTLLRGLGTDRVVWGTDAVWTGSPQWQIEGLRRQEIPVDMQKKYGFKPLGAADGPVKTKIFSGNSVRLYNYQA